jgi:ubiquitin carboxyl-terminal hydrolase 25/28
LGELFFEMEFAENPAVTPSLELAKLALVTSKDEEEDNANTSGSAQPRTVEASSSSPSTDATLVEEAVATAHNSHLHKPGGPSGLSSVVPAPAQPSSILGKRPREVDQLGDKASEGSSSAKPRSPRRDGSPPPDKTMRVEEPFHDVEMVVQSLQADEDAYMDTDNASDEAVAPDSVGCSPGAGILAMDDEGPTQEMIEDIPMPLEKAVPPPLPPRKAPVKTNESTMMFGEWTWTDIEGRSCLETGKQHDVSECMDNCMFQIETALLKFDEQASTDSDKMSIVKRYAVPCASA